MRASILGLVVASALLGTLACGDDDGGGGGAVDAGGGGGAGGTDGGASGGSTVDANTTTGGSPSGSGGSTPAGDASSGGAAADGGVDAAPQDAGPVSVDLNLTKSAVRAGGQVDFVATVANDTAGVTWAVTGPGSVSASGSYTVPAGTPSGLATVTATSKADPSKTASATVAIVAPGVVSTTDHPLVARYAIASPLPGRVRVEFGPDVSYEHETWRVETSGTGTTSQFVAGMKAGTAHHLRAVIEFEDGTPAYLDEDHVFTSGDLPSDVPFPKLTVTAPPSKTPQPGLELVSAVSGQPQLFVSDLKGNIVWYYTYTGGKGDIVNPAKQLPNGNILAIISPASNSPVLTTPLAQGVIDVLREIDLEGKTVREMTRDQLAVRLQTAAANGCAECDFVPGVMHHEVTPLPDGKFALITNNVKTCGEVGCTPAGNAADKVLGDAIVVLDADWNPVWAWNTFSHLSVNRSVPEFPDWTHSNAIVYSATDGNLMLSSRHLHWLIKVNYADGSGDGSVLWKMGNGGDFALQGGTLPYDWFNAQHEPSFTTASNAGKFSLIVFDNGTFRPFGAVTCGSPDLPCLYSATPILEVDEAAKTAKITYNAQTPAYSRWGGNAEVLPNGNVHYAVSNPTAQTEADIYEMTRETPPQLVHRLNIKTAYAYRGHRLDSLYPGVTY